MFGNKKRDSRINRTELDIESNRGMVVWSLKEVERIDKKLKFLEDYLNIEYKEESTKGYVKKEIEEADVTKALDVIRRGVMESIERDLEGRGLGRKFNNKKK